MIMKLGAPRRGDRDLKFMITAILVVVAAFGLSACDQTSKMKLNHAAALGWREYVRTDLDMSEFYGANFTLAARFMVQYPTAYVGPILATSGSGLELSKQDAATTLVARFGSTLVTYGSVNLQGGKWHHAAIVRTNNSLKLYLDGQPACPTGLANCAVAVNATTPTGDLRLGRPGTDPISGSAESQHYGFVDDVAVFKVALTQNQIQSLISTARLLGNEANLHAGWTFDTGTPSGAALPSALTRPVVYQTITSAGTVVSKFPHTQLVSQARDNANDEKFLKFPNNQVSLRLPFPMGEAWVVGQGWQGFSGKGSHNGRAAFAWDFDLAGKPKTDTNGKPFYAAAPGPVVEVKDDSTCGPVPVNHVDIRHAVDEIGVYLHHVKGTAAVSVGQTVAVGTKLANTGDTGTGCGNYHLHFALHNKPESQAGDLVTIPATFENYEVSTDNGATWQPVVKGIPKEGQWVRNPP
jgi:murein DD-endopeptidase MepM/ murein hydrolase activator NlpD